MSNVEYRLSHRPAPIGLSREFLASDPHSFYLERTIGAGLLAMTRVWGRKLHLIYGRVESILIQRTKDEKRSKKLEFQNRSL